jgi:hypothetical protein
VDPEDPVDGSLPAGLIGSQADGLEIANGDDALVTFAQMAQGMMGADEMRGNVLVAGIL